MLLKRGEYPFLMVKGLLRGSSSFRKVADFHFLSHSYTYNIYELYNTHLLRKCFNVLKGGLNE